MIRVYQFEHAPKKLQALSQYNGYEKWVILSDKDEKKVAKAVAEKLSVCCFEEYVYSGGGIFEGKHIFITDRKGT